MIVAVSIHGPRTVAPNTLEDRNGCEESTIRRSATAHFLGKWDVPEERQAVVTPDRRATVRASARKSR